jgi:hypothetical protein
VKVGIKGAVHLPHGTIVLWLRGPLSWGLVVVPRRR